MKKLIVSLAVILSILVSTAVCAFAAAPAKNGFYEVPIQFRSADEATDQDGSFFGQIGQLEVNNGKKYLTIGSLPSVLGVQLYYYIDGSVTGDTAPAQIVKDIEIDGTKYRGGYRIPVNGNGDSIGIKLNLPFTSTSVSGKIYIDYNNCHFVSELDSFVGNDNNDIPEVPTEKETFVFEYPYSLKKPSSNNGADIDYNYNGGSADEETETAAEKKDSAKNEDTKETKVVKVVKQKESSTGTIIGGVILAVVILALVGWVVISKMKEKK